MIISVVPVRRKQEEKIENESRMIYFQFDIRMTIEPSFGKLSKNKKKEDDVWNDCCQHRTRCSDNNDIDNREKVLYCLTVWGSHTRADMEIIERTNNSKKKKKPTFFLIFPSGTDGVRDLFVWRWRNAQEGVRGVYGRVTWGGPDYWQEAKKGS